ncbi:hypothetical protein K491DRAFT_686542 [Lophiostoma macrostomum CBS 122681]|uniref:Nudix hydrolase domain-containing protein n=1 Tax=Lophiostoma macrostomum CBS 122681 TaxID=1314788 RepID=A0A6A6TRJ3_9PLEO|nr:hypothetical protein K491DRAFT_686542 [Lophiostoma macrostomum CBS 122681]
MSPARASFEYPPALQQYMITEAEFFEQNPQYGKLCTGVVVFDDAGRMLLVQRAKEEKAFPNLWEIPGGKVDDTDESILHGVARELKEEAGLDVTRVIRKIGEFGWEEYHTIRKRQEVWRKLIFEVEVKELNVVLDPEEHQHYVFATEEDVLQDKAGGIQLTWISPPNKAMNLEAFKSRRATEEQ